MVAIPLQPVPASPSGVDLNNSSSANFHVANGKSISTIVKWSLLGLICAGLLTLIIVFVVLALRRLQRRRLNSPNEQWYGGNDGHHMTMTQAPHHAPQDQEDMTAPAISNGLEKYYCSTRPRSRTNWSQDRVYRMSHLDPATQASLNKIRRIQSKPVAEQRTSRNSDTEFAGFKSRPTSVLLNGKTSAPCLPKRAQTIESRSPNLSSQAVNFSRRATQGQTNRKKSVRFVIKPQRSTQCVPVLPSRNSVNALNLELQSEQSIAALDLSLPSTRISWNADRF